MRIKGISEQRLRFAVESVSSLQYDGNIVFKREPDKKGNFLHFTLTVLDSAGPGGRRSHTGRRVAAACWHAHRDIMQAIFQLEPDALLITAFARYEGQYNFRDTFEATGYNNIGSIAQPLYMRDACTCDGEW